MCLKLTSIVKKQIVALTGLGMILFLVGHLAGNLFIFGGPDAFNHYAKKLASLRPALNFIEAGLVGIFIIHIWLTVLLVLENIKSRGGIKRYAVDQSVGQRSIASRIMPYSGAYLFFFIIWHLFDFTFVDHQGPRSYIFDATYGLYGVVVNSFFDPMHSALYVIAMCFLGLHLVHGVQSTMQTLGFNHPKYTPMIKKISQYFALLMVIGYSSIPVYVFLFLSS